MSKETSFTVGRFKLGAVSESSAMPQNPYNNHLYLGARHLSFSTRSWFFPVRAALGRGDMEGNFFLNLGVLRWNLVFEYHSAKLIKELRALGARICQSRFSIRLERIGSRKSSLYLYQKA